LKTIGMITSSRADYGICRPIMEAIRADGHFELEVVATGAHLDLRFGSVHDIEEDGFDVVHRVPIPLSDDSPRGIAEALGAGVAGFGALYARWRPDLLVVIGDRFEMYAAALASLPHRILLAHVHGGELTLGAIDDALRHSITKIAHLHFVATESYARRVRQLGEEDWRITVCGAPSLDNLLHLEVRGRAELLDELDLPRDACPIIVTFHPPTRDYSLAEAHIGTLLEALDAVDGPIVFTAPNTDTNSGSVRRAMQDFVAGHPSARFVENLGTRGYFGLMAIARAMVGNSSSGIIEAASFALPVVDVGDRQQGRDHGRNVIHVPARATDISEGLKRVLDPGFRASLDGLANPYGDGRAAQRIVAALHAAPETERLMRKAFVDR
jgi:UDP-hydrolysing UDP-N-acetyl-D-glucosamine 2-epimerase